MVDKKYLRIGNIVKDEGEYYEVTALDHFDITCTNILTGGMRMAMGYDYYEPVELKPELLERCGFMKQNNGWHLKKDHDRGYMDDIFGLFDSNYCKGKLNLKLNGSNLPMPKIKYLHTLQNVYFFICEKELKIKL